MKKGPVLAGVPVVLLCLAILSLNLVPQLAAQQATAQLNGTVKDASGALVPGAKLELKNSKTNVSKTTMSDNST